MERVIENAVESVRLMHGAEIENMDEFTQVARMYLDCIDKEGFVFDFDLAWRAAGYSTKGNAKRVLLRAPFVEGQHYTITTAVGQMGQTTEAGQTQETAYQPGGASLQGENSSVQHGGQNREFIRLTANGMGQFCLSAQTERGRMLRDFVMQLTLGFKRFAAAVQAGEIEVRRRVVDTRDAKRLKACDTQKLLMVAASATGDGPRMNAGDYARINGVTNKIVTGRYKHELAKELGKPASSVNARDYMRPVQLTAVSIIEELSAERMQKDPQADPVEVHKATALSFEGCFRQLHETAIPEHRSLREARREGRAIAAAPSSTGAAPMAVPVAAIAAAPTAAPVINISINTLDRYFSRHTS
jgi:hypothetical protein